MCKYKKNSKIITPICIDINDLSSPKKLNNGIWNRLLSKNSDIKIEIDSTLITYPNICLPIAGVLDYYGKNAKLTISDKHDNGYITHTCYQNPYIAEQTSPDVLGYPLDKVWKFSTPEGVNILTDAIIDKVRKSDVVEDGILQGMTWCLYETMDNVLQHADIQCGFVMGQLQKESHRLVVAVFDYGRGILDSFKGSQYSPGSHKDAISLALQERVTRDQSIGQGNGMWGLSQLVIDNGGMLRVSSGGQGIQIATGNTTDISSTICLNMGPGHRTTLVDFQLDYHSPIDVKKILGSPVDLWLENHELDSGEITFNVIDECAGTGTRQSAERFRNIVINSLKESHSKIIIDFTGVNFISSSFADELIGKIISKFGIVSFMENFKLTNISKQNRAIINRSVEQRLAQKYYDENIPDSGDE